VASTAGSRPDECGSGLAGTRMTAMFFLPYPNDNPIDAPVRLIHEHTSPAPPSWSWTTSPCGSSPPGGRRPIRADQRAGWRTTRKPEPGTASRGPCSPGSGRPKPTTASRPRWACSPAPTPSGRPGRCRCASAARLMAAAVRSAAVSASLSGGGNLYERDTLGVRGDILLWVALQASLMAECFADGAGDADCGIGMSELIGASHVGDHPADGEFGLCHARRSS
jgi:hypothetical protein